MEHATKMLEGAITNGTIRAVSIASGKVDGPLSCWAKGQLTDDASAQVEPSHRFLVGSLTKPITAVAAMKLVEIGEVSLSTRVRDVLPSFRGDGKDEMQVWHLLTHTSGLADMVSNNKELRQQGAGLDNFYSATCDESLSFAPGTGVQYQSMGSLVLATIVERITGLDLRDFLKTELFEPAGMASSELGLNSDQSLTDDVMTVLPQGQVSQSWNWNSEYWRRLGAPWGGLLSTAHDLALFVQLFLREGSNDEGRQVLNPATVRTMLRDWVEPLGLGSGMGLSWKLRGKSPPVRSSGVGHNDPAGVTANPAARDDRTFMGDIASPRSFGHGGATGCLMFGDPENQLAVVVLSSNQQALRTGYLGRVSTAIMSAYQ